MMVDNSFGLRDLICSNEKNGQSVAQANVKYQERINGNK